ncbi:BET1-like [Papilio machaon]|uniref:BET1-like n=1 Tax=Papilio machaon TaxID=76193 RepID=A0A194RC87_PAPMA|nr:BET1-like [Papilio machaon]
MRRARDGYQYQPIPRVATEDVLEHENERMAEELSGKISTLKHMSIEIGNEVRIQDKILRGLDDDVDRSSGFLGKTMGRDLLRDLEQLRAVSMSNATMPQAFCKLFLLQYPFKLSKIIVFGMLCHSGYIRKFGYVRRPSASRMVTENERERERASVMHVIQYTERPG